MSSLAYNGIIYARLLMKLRLVIIRQPGMPLNDAAIKARLASYSSKALQLASAGMPLHHEVGPQH